MVRDGEIETEQADDGADQPFGLPQSQAEHDAQRQRRRNRQGRIVWLTALRSPCSARQAAIASSLNQTVRLPRWRKAASYSDQFVTRSRCLGM